MQKTDVRGNRDLIQNGVNGILVPVNDIETTEKAIDRLSRDEQLRQKKGREGRRIIEDFSLEDMAEICRRSCRRFNIFICNQIIRRY
ncbi:glycosyltransferase [Thermoanaerobacteraceae bacterium SP2]|nr:glycosyltransferase [Thermoanaerobacteraceae bacterium SP2]